MVCLCLFLLVTGSGGWSVYAQTAGGPLLTEEIKTLKKTLETLKISVADRHRSLTRLARLLQLSGNLEESVLTWMDAAFVDPGKQDDTALLEVVRCFIALGELDKAEASVQVVLQNSKDPKNLLEAQYLRAVLELFRSGNTAPLVALIKDPAYERYRPGMYYTLWRASGDGAYKSKLLADYGLSPEALIAGDPAALKGGTIVVGASPSAMWLLFPGRRGVELSVATTTAAPAGESAVVALQTGFFGKEENARILAEQLKNAGFHADVSRRTRAGAIYWLVSVPPGANTDKTIAQLKKAGFDSFPIFNADL
ncbi:MAG: SPOR domain-containing protein [Treponema sp.]|jgi:tetratricopeptide (TPR) repeat protein|nr:SPOR domain-containing protein [Treponema sp.]